MAMLICSIALVFMVVPLGALLCTNKSLDNFCTSEHFFICTDFFCQLVDCPDNSYESPARGKPHLSDIYQAYCQRF